MRVLAVLKGPLALLAGGDGLVMVLVLVLLIKTSITRMPKKP